MPCRVFEGGVICGEFAEDDGQWHNGGYSASMHKCENCRLCARFFKVEGMGRREKTRYRCGGCVPKKEGSEGGEG
jgi:hypothetical protein